MANQQALTLEAILSIKRALAREKGYEAEAEPEAPKTTNRGNKLKRRAEYYHQGELGGRIPYRRKIEHAGYSRYILKRNPRRFDEEGFELLTDEEDEEADKEAAEKDPYAGIAVEQLLMPLTHAKELENHPALSLPYKSKTLPQMVQQTMEMVHREKRTLVELKLLMERLRGDQPWVPAGAMMRDDDTALFGTELQPGGSFAAPPLLPFDAEESKTDTLMDVSTGPDWPEPSLPANDDKSHNSLNSDVEPKTREEEPAKEYNGEHANGNAPADVEQKGNESVVVTNEEDMAMADVSAEDHKKEVTDGGQQLRATPEREALSKTENVDQDVARPERAASIEQNQARNQQPENPNGIDSNNAELSKSSNPPTPSAISSAGSSPPPRMQTRARTNAANGTPQLGNVSRTVSPDVPRPASPPQSLHPIYIPLASTLVDRDIGLPAVEAEELRRLLSHYVQKQEEVCRGADRLYHGLLHALKLRDTLWWWCRAEGHRGDPSDGEDWVDLEEWALTEELRKGDAMVEDSAEEPGKKTRGRRAAG